MAVNIRLSRGGSKKRPYYKIVVADARSPRDGRVIERIGSYNPLLAKDNPERIKLDVERAKHWIGVGAQPTDRVARFLDALGVKERPARNNPTPRCCSRPRTVSRPCVPAWQRCARSVRSACAAS